MPVATKIQLRRDTAANWTSTNPTLAIGEAGYETDTKKMKIGTGALAWNALGYYSTPNVIIPAFSATPVIDAAAIGPNGVWRLTLTGNVTSSTIINPVDGQTITVQLIQSVTGPWTFAWPSNVFNAQPIRTVGYTTVCLVYSAAISQWYREDNPQFPPNGLYGDITVAGAGQQWDLNPNVVTTTEITDAAVTNAQLANAAASTLKGNNLTFASVPADLTAAQVRTLLGLDVTAWTAVTFQNSWANFGAGMQVAQYRKVGDVVEVRGVIQSGATATVAFTLPAGFVPPATQTLPVVGPSGALASVTVATTGTVAVISASGTSGVGIAFRFSTI
jgi:hypothetical protein